MAEGEKISIDTLPEEEKWKYRAPYRVHESNGDFDAKYEANCHCGAIKYQLSREAPLASKLCHCVDCQAQHSAPFQWAAVFHKDDINFVHGHHNLEWYDPGTKEVKHKLPCKVRCNHCHSPVMDEGRNMILLFPSLLHLKTKKAKESFKPSYHMFYDQRVIDIPDGLPKWGGMEKVSELVADSPADMVKDLTLQREKEKDKENGEKDKENSEK